MTKSVFKISHQSPTFGCVSESTKASETQDLSFEFDPEDLASNLPHTLSPFDPVFRMKSYIPVFSWNAIQCYDLF